MDKITQLSDIYVKMNSDKKKTKDDKSPTKPGVNHTTKTEVLVGMDDD